MKKSKVLGLVLIVTILVTALAVGCSSSTPAPTTTAQPTATGAATATPTGTAVATATTAPSGQVIEIKFADQHPPTNGMNEIVNPGWKNWLEKQSNGRLKISFYFASSAAAPPDEYDAMRNGIVDISCQSLGYVKGRFPLYEVGGLPLLFTFPGSQAASYVMDKLMAKYPEMSSQFQDVHFLTAHANGPSHVHTIKQPVHTIADLKGLVLNASGDQAQVLKLLGGTPESLLPTEAYDALAKRVLDGNLLEWEGETIWHYVEQVNYSTEVGLALSPFIHAMNLDTWKGLPPDLQVLFNEQNSFDYGQVQGWLFDQDEIKDRKGINDIYLSRGNPEIYVLPKEERDKWVQAAMPMRTDWVTKYASKGPTQAILDDAIALEDEFRNSDYNYAGTLLHEWGGPEEGTWWTAPK